MDKSIDNMSGAELDRAVAEAAGADLNEIVDEGPRLASKPRLVFKPLGLLPFGAVFTEFPSGVKMMKVGVMNADGQMAMPVENNVLVLEPFDTGAFAQGTRVVCPPGTLLTARPSDAVQVEDEDHG